MHKLSYSGDRKRILIRSEGCRDKGRASGCGRAYIKISGKDYSPHRRGYNFVVINAVKGI